LGSADSGNQQWISGHSSNLSSNGDEHDMQAVMARNIDKYPEAPGPLLEALA